MRDRLGPLCSALHCVDFATHKLIGPGGEDEPGGPVCREHGEQIAEEYRSLLCERWTLEPISEDSHA